MLHGEVWNVIQRNLIHKKYLYLYDMIEMEKTLELQKSVEGEHMATPYEPWSYIYGDHSPPPSHANQKAFGDGIGNHHEELSDMLLNEMTRV